MRKAIIGLLVTLLLSILIAGQVAGQATRGVDVSSLDVHPISLEQVNAAFSENDLYAQWFNPKAGATYYAVVVTFDVRETRPRETYENARIAIQLLTLDPETESLAVDPANVRIVAYAPDNIDLAASFEEQRQEPAQFEATVRALKGGIEFDKNTTLAYERLYRTVSVHKSPPNRIEWTFKPSEISEIFPGTYSAFAIAEIKSEAIGVAVSAGCCSIRRTPRWDPFGWSNYYEVERCAVGRSVQRPMPADASLEPSAAPVMDSCDLVARVPTPTPTPSPILARRDCGEIGYGETVYGEFAEIGDSCTYSFYGQSGDRVNIRMIGQSEDLDSWVDLEDAYGTVLLSNDDGAGGHDSAINDYLLPDSDTYAIVARSYNDGSVGAFQLSLTVSPQTCGGEIGDGETVYGEIAEIGDSCTYSFYGQAGDRVNIRMIGLSEDLDSWVDLENADGTVLLSNDDGAGGHNSAINDYQLPDSDTYAIVARSYGDGSTGAFELSLTKSSLQAFSGSEFLASIDATVESLRFFETGRPIIPPHEREFVYQFPRETEGNIAWELGLSYPPPGERIDFEIHAICYRPDGDVFAQQNMDAYALPDWDNSQHAMIGWSSPGEWERGTYIVALYIENIEIARASFVIE